MIQSFYVSLLGALVVVAVAVEFFAGRGKRPTHGSEHFPPTFVAFRNSYLIIYCMAMAGDWLQGPYIYALYEFYGYQVGDIGRLFIAGFGSSMIFGTVVGALADKYGRKKATVLYMLSYSLSCLTKHSMDYWVLMFGRLLGGVATSLLFTAFESWLVAEHFSRGFSESLLGHVFSKATYLGAGLMAIVSGMIGNLLVEDMRLGPVAPFDFAVIVMISGAGIILFCWSENYGGSTHSSIAQQFQDASAAIMADQRIMLLGTMQSFFEASMYTFVFLWTPALSPNGEKLSHGMVFSCFMTACMVGSALSGLLMRRFEPQRFMIYVYLVAALAMMIPFVFHLGQSGQITGQVPRNKSGDGISLQGKIELLAFCLFEGCVGIFWPSMMALRAHYVPEKMRSTILNAFRVPLNLFVCAMLYKDVQLLSLCQASLWTICPTCFRGSHAHNQQ